MSDNVDKILELHRALVAAGLRHAFGGALALAWCTERARGTIDIDLNIFVNAKFVNEVLSAMPEGVLASATSVSMLVADGQARLMWDSTPIDIFLNTTPFHAEVATRVREEAFAGEAIPFLSCSDIAVFKAFFNRSRDWADIEDMRDAGTLDFDRVAGVLVRYLGGGDQRVERLRSLVVDDQ